MPYTVTKIDLIFFFFSLFHMMKDIQVTTLLFLDIITQEADLRESFF